jgi:hypothetical protein
MLGFLSKVWELIKSFASDLFSAFLKIIDFTQGVGLKPVTGIVTTILSLLLYAILSVITLAVKTCSAMYKLTINPVELSRKV